MTFSKLLTSALAGVALLALAGPASADQLADIKAAGKIVTSVDMHFTPFGMVVDGKYEGLNKDLFDEVAKELGVEPVYQDIPWPAQLPGMEVKKFDIVTTAAAITPERLERYAFTLPVVYAPVGLIRAAGNEAVRKPEDIKGKVAGAIQGSTQAKKLRAFSDKIGGVDIREYGTIDEAYADLVAGRLDAVAGTLPILAYLVTKRPESFALLQPAEIGDPDYLAWVGRKDEDSASLMKAIDDAILKMTDDGRMKAIQEKWLGTYVELPREVPTK
ncbi:MAG: transporter substrate-binding domain-containing protein [Mesorhizobium sp.]